MLEKRTEPPSVCRYREESESSTVRSAPSRIWVRAKLEMSAPGDSDESEADSVADTVTAGGKIFRHISGSGGGGSGIPFPSHLESRLLSGQGGGFSMPSTVRKPMENAFGRDFSDVRFHSDGESSRLSRSISARAFTYGNDIYFAQGQYAPHTPAGRHLIAHELTHVVQGGGKVSREADHAEQRAIIQSYYVENWHWGQFYTYLATFHPQVVDALKLELDAGFFDTDWKDDRGPAFMNSVSSAIVADIRRRNKNMNWDAAYSRAIREFNTCRNRLYPKIKPVFDCLIDLTRKGQERNGSGNTRTISGINAQRKNDLDSSSFSGEYFNNGESFLKDVYAFFKNEYPDALSYINHFAVIFQRETIDEVSDMDEMRSAKFAEQLEPYIDSFIDKRSNAHIATSGRSGNAAKVNEMHYFLTKFISEIAAHEKRYKSAGMLREVVESRLKNLYSTEFHVPEALVSSKAWTELFFRIMLEGGSMLFGGPLIGRIMSVVVLKNPVARVLIEQAANVALDFVSGAGEEMIMEKVKGEDLDAKKILQEAGMSVLMGRLFDVGMQGVAKYKGSFSDASVLDEADDVFRAVSGKNVSGKTSDTGADTLSGALHGGTGEGALARNGDVISPTAGSGSMKKAEEAIEKFDKAAAEFDRVANKINSAGSGSMKEAEKAIEKFDKAAAEFDRVANKINSAGSGSMKEAEKAVEKFDKAAADFERIEKRITTADKDVGTSISGSKKNTSSRRSRGKTEVSPKKSDRNVVRTTIEKIENLFGRFRKVKGTVGGNASNPIGGGKINGDGKIMESASDRAGTILPTGENVSAKVTEPSAISGAEPSAISGAEPSAISGAEPSAISGAEPSAKLSEPSASAPKVDDDPHSGQDHSLGNNTESSPAIVNESESPKIENPTNSEKVGEQSANEESMMSGDHARTDKENSNDPTEVEDLAHNQMTEKDSGGSTHDSDSASAPKVDDDPHSGQDHSLGNNAESSQDIANESESLKSDTIETPPPTTTHDTTPGTLKSEPKKNSGNPGPDVSGSKNNVKDKGKSDSPDKKPIFSLEYGWAFEDRALDKLYEKITKSKLEPGKSAPLSFKMLIKGFVGAGVSGTASYLLHFKDDKTPSEDDAVSAAMGAAASVPPLLLGAVAVALLGELIAQEHSKMDGDGPGPYEDIDWKYPLWSGATAFLPFSPITGPIVLSVIKSLGSDAAGIQPADSAVPSDNPPASEGLIQTSPDISVPQPQFTPDLPSVDSAVMRLEKSVRNRRGDKKQLKEDMKAAISSLKVSGSPVEYSDRRKNGKIRRRMLSLAETLVNLAHRENKRENKDEELVRLYCECAAYLIFEESYYHINTRDKRQEEAMKLFPLSSYTYG